MTIGTTTSAASFTKYVISRKTILNVFVWVVQIFVIRQASIPTSMKLVFFI